MHDLVDRPARTARTFVHHYNDTQYCITETVLLIFPFLRTNNTSQMRPSGGKGTADYMETYMEPKRGPFLSYTEEN